MAHARIALSQFADTFAAQIELSSVALGGRIVAVSDDFFAAAHHLLLVEPAPSLKGQFGPNGALFSGWESRRHNATGVDWCIIQLGCAGSVHGLDIDTAHFSGNEAPQASVDVLYAPDGADPLETDPRWTPLLPRVDLGPNARHLFTVPPSARANFVKLSMYPDGGIARFRAYGLVAPVFPAARGAEFDLAHVFAGAHVVRTSDEHFGVGANLILPGRGKDMGDGWETKRSRAKGHHDWAVIKLGAPGHLTQVEIDTAHFKGNFPESCELHATSSSELFPPFEGVEGENRAWTLVLPRTPLGPHRRHFFQLENVVGQSYTHVRLTIYPDGGIKRVRVLGRRADADADVGTTDAALATVDTSEPTPTNDAAPAASAAASSTAGLAAGPTLPLLPLTPEAFAPFGHVIQAFSSPAAAPRGTRVTPANQGTATKFHKLAPLVSSYPAGLASAAAPGLSVFRCEPLEARPGDAWAIRRLERHAYTSQAFVPMGGAAGKEGETNGWGAEDALREPGSAYVVIVAQNGSDDGPDLGSMRAFVANAGQGISYHTGIWHHPMAVLERTIDFTCVETQIGNGDKADCEVVELDGAEGYYSVRIPAI